MWITPKTDWSARYDASGAFLGDFINIADYNRIKNNLDYLLDLASEIFIVPTVNLGNDKTYSDYPYADEWNLIETTLSDLCGLIGIVFPAIQFYENGTYIGFAELNRIESMELQLYGQITAAIAMRNRLAFTLATNRNTIKC
jgi:hypothetical protein